MKHLSHLNKYLFKYIWYLVLGTSFIVCTNYFKVLMPLVIDSAADLVEFFVNNKENMSKDDMYSEGMFLFGKLLLYAFINTFFLFLTRQTIIVMSRLIEFDLKNEIYDKYQSLSFSFYKKNATGDIMNRISEDVGHVRMYLGPAIMYSINVLVLATMTVVMMANVSSKLTLFVLIPLPIMSVIIFKVSQVINKKSGKVQGNQSRLSTLSQEAFSGIRVLKSFDKMFYFSEIFSEANKDYRKASISLAKTNAYFMPVIMMLIGLSNIITVILGGIEVIEGRLDIGDVVAFLIYVNLLTWPFAAIGWVSSLVQRAAASQERINEFIQTPIEITEVAAPFDSSLSSVAFENVSFTYPNTGIEALKNISFKIEPGQTIGITGRTGSGKSTIATLMLRLFDPSAGQITVNDKSLKDWSIKGLRSQIGYVPQEVFLFSDTIRNNIAFGIQGEIGDDEVIESARNANIHENIIGFEEGYETKVGERGITLSGGQKQRVSIARALIRKPNLFVFDDCLSAVDTETEETILSNLKEATKDAMGIIISHRISTLKHADIILVLDDGEIIERGNHNDLIGQKGLYADMYHKQLVDEK